MTADVIPLPIREKPTPRRINIDPRRLARAVDEYGFVRYRGWGTVDGQPTHVSIDEATYRALIETRGGAAEE